MTQAQLERAVAQATGESLATIRRRGFGFVDPGDCTATEELDSPQVVDWDALDNLRYGLSPK